MKWLIIFILVIVVISATITYKAYKICDDVTCRLDKFASCEFCESDLCKKHLWHYEEIYGNKVEHLLCKDCFSKKILGAEVR